MTSLATAKVTGISGTQYELQVDPIGTQYKERSGVYGFLIPRVGGWNIAYFGETDNFQRRLFLRLDSHDQWACIQAAGATHIGTLHVPGVLSAREGIETDLRQAYVTSCNQQSTPLTRALRGY